MAHYWSMTVKNGVLDAIETLIGTAPVMKIRTGTKPGITAADSGTVLVSLSLPSNWMDAAAAGVKVKLGTWTGTATAAGSAGHYRLYASNGTTQHDEGSVTAEGGGGDLVLLVNDVPGIVIAIGDVVVVDVYYWDF